MFVKLGTWLWIVAASLLSYPVGVFLHDVATAAVGMEQSFATGTEFAAAYTIPAVILGLLAAQKFARAPDVRYLKLAVVWTIATAISAITVHYALYSTGVTPPTKLAAIMGSQFFLTGIGLILRRRWLPFFVAVAAAAGLAAYAFLPGLFQLSETVLPLDPLSAPEVLNALSVAAENGRLALALFVLSALVIYAVLRSRIARASSNWSRIFYSGVWSVSSVLVWLFASGLASLLHQIPRVLPIAMVVAMLFFVVALPLVALRLKRQLEFGSLIYNPALRGEKQAWAELHRGAQKSARRAWIISYTGVSNEPRVLRQCEALLSQGWEVIVCGFDGHSARPAAWNFVRLPTTDPFLPWFRNLLVTLNRWALRLTVHGRPRFAFKWAQHVAHGTNPTWLQIRLQVLRVARANMDLRPDMVIAHDYHTADVGYALAKEFKAKFSIDCHEYAVMQYSNDPNWVRWSQPVIRTVQNHYLQRADLVTVVGAGIAELIAAESELQRPPIVIRNVPFSDPQKFRPVGQKIKVLYHGDLSRPREIDMAIKSLPKWRPEFELVLRGGGDVAYIADLKRLADSLGVAERVSFEPAVPFNKIVSSANSADIGYFAYSAYSPQIQYALPNKFFEYVMAGLAICVSDLQEVGRLVKHYGLGSLIPLHTPESIADTINSFTRDSIETHKKAAIAASKELCWESEREALIQGYESMWTPHANVRVFRKAERDTALARSMRGTQLGNNR